MPATDTETMMNIVNICLGVGILSFPWSFAGASIVGGLIITALGTLWCAITNIWLVSFSERTQQISCGRMLRQLPRGHLYEPFADVMLLFCNLLCLVGYLVTFADSFQKVVVEALLDIDVTGQTWLRPALVFLGCCLVFPLCFLDQAKLACTSTISVAANWYICFILFGEAATAERLASVCVAGLGVGDLTMLAVVMMAVSVQQCIVPIYQEMKNKSVRSYTRVQIQAVCVVICLFSGVSIAGYLLVGSGVDSNILLALPKTLPGTMAQVAIIPVVIGIYPLALYPVSVAVRGYVMPDVKTEPLLGDADKDSAEVSTQPECSRTFAAVQLCIVVLTGLVAATGIDLGPITNFAGLLGLGWFTVGMPALVYNRSLELDGKSKTGLWIHLAIGAVCFVLAVAWTGNHVESLERHCFVRWPSA